VLSTHLSLPPVWNTAIRSYHHTSQLAYNRRAKLHDTLQWTWLHHGHELHHFQGGGVGAKPSPWFSANCLGGQFAATKSWWTPTPEPCANSAPRHHEVVHRRLVIWRSHASTVGRIGRSFQSVFRFFRDLYYSLLRILTLLSDLWVQNVV